MSEQYSNDVRPAQQIGNVSLLDQPDQALKWSDGALERVRLTRAFGGTWQQDRYP